MEEVEEGGCWVMGEEGDDDDAGSGEAWAAGAAGCGACMHRIASDGQQRGLSTSVVAATWTTI